MKKIADINLGPLRGPGNIGLEGEANPDIGTSVELLSRILSIVVGFMSVVASTYFLYRVITGGFAIISAGGDKGKVAEARSIITNGVLGLIIVLLSTVFVGFIGTIIGIDILNIESLITQLVN